MASRRPQFRAGVFHLFNQAYPSNTDIEVRLDANCNARVSGVPDGAGGARDVCDPARGFSFTRNPVDNFGKILTRRGNRVVEFALRLFF